MSGQLDLFAWSPEAFRPVQRACEICGKPSAEGHPLGQFEYVCPACGLPVAPLKPRAPMPPVKGSVGELVPWVQQEATLKKSLRDYQQTIREKVHDHFPKAPRGMVVAATGAGKTVCFAAIAADVCAAGGRVLILTDQVDLVDQAIEKLQDVAGLYAAAENADRTASLSARVVVATVQTLVKRLEKYPPDHFTLVVCDECDRAVSATWKKALAHFDGYARVLGVTATPKRADRKNILRYFQTKVDEIDLLTLINRGYLVPLHVQECPITIDLTAAEEATSEGADYDAAAVGEAVTAIFGEALEAWKEHAGDLKTLVFCPDVETSKKFVLEAHRHQVNARHADGASPNRKELKQGFRDWKPGTKNMAAFQMLSNPIFLGRGYDDPSIGCVINLRPTKSVSLYQQIIGRGTRLFCPWGCGGPCEHPERKRRLLVLDFLYQFKSMGPIRPAALFTENDEKIREMHAILADAQGALDLRDVMGQAEKNIEAALVEAIAAAMNKTKGKKGEYYNAMQFAATLHLPDLMEYQPETDEEAKPVPPRMQKKLSGLGFIPDTVPWLGLAKRLVAAVEARKEAGLASIKQVFWLRKWGYPEPWDMDREQANAICTRKFARY